MVRNTSKTRDITERIISVKNEVFEFISSGEMRKQLEENLSFDLHELLNNNNTTIEKSTIENGINSITRLIRYYEKYDTDKFLNFFKENQKLGSWSSYVEFVEALYSNIDAWDFLFRKKYFTCNNLGYNLLTKRLTVILRQLCDENAENFTNNDDSIVIFEFERPINFDNHSILIDDVFGELSRLWLFSFVSSKYRKTFFDLLLSELTKYIKKSFENFLLYSGEIINSNNVNDVNLFLYKYPNCFLSEYELNCCILKTFNSYWDINHNKYIIYFINSDFCSKLTIQETKHIDDVLFDFLVKSNKTLRKNDLFKKELENRGF